MNRTLIWVVLVLVVVAVIGFVVVSNNKNSNSIKVGIITPLSGTFAVNGEEARNAILLAVDQINAQGGILGKQINADVQDGQCDGGAALSAWQKITQVDGAKIVFGGHCSTETLAIAPLASTSQVLVLANITSASKIPNEGDWVFRNSSPSQYIGVKAADYFVKTVGYKRIGVIAENKDFPLTYASYFASTTKADGGIVVYNEQFQPGTTDFRSIITNIKNSNVDAILVSTQGASTAGVFAKQLHDLGIEKAQIYNAGFDLKAFKTGTGGYLPKTFTVVTGYADPDSQGVKDFVAAYQQKYDTPITYNLYYISAAYDMVMRVKNAMIACNSTSDIGCIRNQFKTATSYEGVSGIVPVGSVYSPASSMMTLGVLKADAEGSAVLQRLP